MGVKVWVGGIPRDVTEREIREEFRHCPPLVSLQKKDEYCFLEFEDHTAAEDAIERMQNHKMRGIELKVQLSNDAKRLLNGYPPGVVRKFGEGKIRVDNLPLRAEWQEVKDFFRRSGNVLRADIISDGMGNTTGSAIVIFEFEEEGRKAVGEMDRANFDGQTVRVTLQHTHSRGTVRARVDSPQGKGGRDYRRRSRSRSPVRGSRGGRSPSPAGRHRGGGGGGGGGGGREPPELDRSRAFQARGSRDDFDRGGRDVHRDDMRGSDSWGQRGPPPAVMSLDRYGGSTSSRYSDRSMMLVDDRPLLDNRMLQFADRRTLLDRDLPRDLGDDRGYSRERLLSMGGLSGDRAPISDRRGVPGLLERERFDRDDRYLSGGVRPRSPERGRGGPPPSDLRGFMSSKHRRSPSPPPAARGFQQGNSYSDFSHLRKSERGRDRRGSDSGRPRDRSPRGPRTPPPM